MAEGAEQAGNPAGRWLQKGASDPSASLPLLVEALNTVAQLWSDSFSGLASTDGEFAFQGLQAVRVADLQPRRDGKPTFASLRLPAWEAMAGLVVDRAVMATVVEAFFGGGGEEDTAIAERSLSPVEARIVDVLGGQAAAALTAALRDIAPVKVEFGALQPKIDGAFLGRPATPVLVATFALKAVRRTVEVDLVLPQEAIEARAADFCGDSGAAVALSPDGWSRQLRTEVQRTAVAVQAAIALRPMPLSAVASLKVGQILELPEDARTKVLLRAGDERLFTCELGQSGGFYTVRVDEAVERDPQSPGKGH